MREKPRPLIKGAIQRYSNLLLCFLCKFFDTSPFGELLEALLSLIRDDSHPQFCGVQKERKFQIDFVLFEWSVFFFFFKSLHPSKAKSI